MKITLIDNARQWYRMASMQVAMLWSALIMAWPMLTEQQRSDILAFFGIPPEFLGAVTALAMLTSYTAARVTKQESLHKPPEDQQ